MRRIAALLLRSWLAALLCGAALAIASAALAAPLSIDYRCDAAAGNASVPTLPDDGWTSSANGRVPGTAGTPCWLRIDTSSLAPLVMRINGADGFKSVTVFDAAGKRLAVANDIGPRENAIAGSSNGDAAMLFRCCRPASCTPASSAVATPCL